MCNERTAARREAAAILLCFAAVILLSAAIVHGILARYGGECCPCCPAQHQHDDGGPCVDECPCPPDCPHEHDRPGAIEPEAGELEGRRPAWRGGKLTAGVGRSAERSASILRPWPAVRKYWPTWPRRNGGRIF